MIDARQEDALMNLYQHLTSKSADTRYISLPLEQRRDYMRRKKAESRQRQRASAARGEVENTDANVRAALADAALLILATDAPGADQVRTVLGRVFEARPGVPMTVSSRARTGGLRPKLLRLPTSHLKSS